jgi:hypothetical protein
MKLLRFGVGLAGALALSACATSVTAQPPRHAQHSRGNAARSVAGLVTQGHSQDGTVTGSFSRVGGPISSDGTQPAEQSLSGTVQFIRSRSARAPAQRGPVVIVTVRVGRSGKFSLRMPAGRYQVWGRSPSIIEVLPSGAQRETPCAGPLPVTVIPHRTLRLAVTCVVP